METTLPTEANYIAVYPPKLDEPDGTFRHEWILEWQNDAGEKERWVLTDNQWNALNIVVNQPRLASETAPYGIEFGERAVRSA